MAPGGGAVREQRDLGRHPRPSSRIRATRSRTAAGAKPTASSATGASTGGTDRARSHQRAKSTSGSRSLVRNPATA